MRYNYEAEREVISTLVKRKASEYIYAITEEDFCYPEHKALYRMMYRIVISEQEITLATMYEQSLRENDGNHLMTVITKIARETLGYLENVEQHISILKECTKVRKAENTLTACLEAFDDGADYASVRERIISAFSNEEEATDGIEDIRSMMKNTMGYIKSKIEGNDKGIKTGLTEYDRITDGFHKGELTIIGARPAVGKSAFAMYCAMKAAEAGNKVFVCSREMSDTQYGTRIVSYYSNVTNTAMRKGLLGDSDIDGVKVADRYAGKLPVKFTFKIKYIEDLKMAVRDMAKNGEVDLLVVDYLQLMQTREKFNQDYLRIGYVSKMLKDMSLEYDIAVIALAQVGRNSDGTMPTLGELRGSGDMEQDADNVVFLHRVDKNNSDEAHPDDRSLIDTLKSMGRQYIVVNIAKQRQGEIKKFPLMFDPAHMDYREIPRERK